MQKETMKMEIVTPDTARHYLTQNTKNRTINRRRVRQLANDMKDGKWLFDGAAIKFDTNEQLMDGQHRLTAVVESGVATEFLVIRNLEPETFKVMDTGKPRNGKDAFAVEGVKSAALTAATCTFMIKYKSKLNGDGLKADRVTNQDALEFYREHPEIMEHVDEGHKNYRVSGRLLPSSQFCAYRALMAEVNVTKSEEFWHKFSTGVGLTERSPILHLRNALIRNNAKTSLNSKMSSAMRQALVIKAWNYFLEGKEINKLSYTASKDALPKIV